MKLILLFLTFVFLFSCSPEEDDPVVTELPFFFIATLNGQVTGFAAGSTQGASYRNGSFSMIAQPGTDSFHVFEGTTVFDEATFPSGSATVGMMGIFSRQPVAEERAGLFTPGVKKYALADSTRSGGAFVRFVDGKGISWSSENHAQPDTSFRIELLTTISDTGATNSFQARFTCRLFNSTGDSMLLENGSVRGKILKP